MGRPIANGKVTLLKQGADFIGVNTGPKGQFSIKGLKEGNYEMKVEADGFHTYHFPIVVDSPDNKCRGALEVILSFGPDYCTRIRLVKSKAVK
jgi:hypothetical protein